jgi:hypothetical protein
MVSFYTIILKVKKTCLKSCTVTQANNPCYLGGGDWENFGSRPVWGKSSEDPYLK